MLHEHCTSSRVGCVRCRSSHYKLLLLSSILVANWESSPLSGNFLVLAKHETSQVDLGSSKPPQRLQGVAIKGRLMCGGQGGALNATKVKIVDLDQRPDKDDLLSETLTDETGQFRLAGATREAEDIEVVVKIYHDCMDEHKPCQRKVTWKIPKSYHNNGTIPPSSSPAWFDVGAVNMELIFPHEAFFWLTGIAHALKVAPFPFSFTRHDALYGPVDEEELLVAREQAREMFYFGYNNYMNHAYPLDELDPIHCRGRGPDHANPDNINLNDALGDYSLTLIDSLSTLVAMGDKREFHRAVQLVIDTVTSERNTTVQVFEATIRVVGALLSAHLVLTNENPHHGDFRMPRYNGELLSLANEIAARLLPAFEGTRTGIPYPRVNLSRGVLPGTVNETCTAGAGSMLLEFGVLSRLLGDPTYEAMARRVNEALWQRRHPKTGLLGNSIDVQTGEWRGTMSGVGAGLDSFFEYLLKAYILFGEPRDLELFAETTNCIESHVHRGSSSCRRKPQKVRLWRTPRVNQSVCGVTTQGSNEAAEAPLYANVHMHDGSIANTWVDAMQASYPAVQVLAGDLDGAICSHAFYYALWQRYEMLPERFNWHLKAPDLHFYPLRPEFIESTYMLYLATRSPFYQRIGMQIIDSLNLHSRVSCGFATVHNVIDKSLEDRMESFFLAETCKYLYLLFDKENPANRNYHKLIYSTEGHPFPISAQFRYQSVDGGADNGEFNGDSQESLQWSHRRTDEESENKLHSFENASCEPALWADRLRAPIPAERLQQYYGLVGYIEEEERNIVS